MLAATLGFTIGIPVALRGLVAFNATWACVSVLSPHRRSLPIRSAAMQPSSGRPRPKAWLIFRAFWSASLSTKPFQPWRAICSRRLLRNSRSWGERLAEVEAKLMAWYRNNECCRRLAQIPGVGPIGAALLVMKAPARTVRIRKAVCRLARLGSQTAFKWRSSTLVWN